MRGGRLEILSAVAGVLGLKLNIAEHTDPNHNPMIPHTIVLEPSLVIYRIYNGLLVLRPADRRGAAPGSARSDLEMPGRLGHHDAGAQSRMGAGSQGALLPYGKSYARAIAEQS
jgi:hypothetical protein